MLVIAGITVPVARNGGFVKRPSEKIGSASRAYAGNLRSTYRAEKRVWHFATRLLTDADASAIETAVALGAQVTCSGTLLGGSVTAVIELDDSTYTAVSGGSFKRALSGTIREV